jgi:hypothetical protein
MKVAASRLKPMNPGSASKEPLVSVSYRRPEESDRDAPLRASRAVLALARLIGRQIAREQHVAQRQHEEGVE